MLLRVSRMLVTLISLFELMPTAMAAVACMRALAGFAFPLFAPKMYAALGYGWGDTLLALLAIVLGCPAYVSVQLAFLFVLTRVYNRPFVFWKYGKRIRMRSRYVRKMT
jgi:hypothetical protein